MAQTGLKMEQVWADFRALSPVSRVAFLQLLLTDEKIRDELEDASDLLDIAERRDESSIPFDEVMDGIRDR